MAGDPCIFMVSARVVVQNLADWAAARNLIGYVEVCVIDGLGRPAEAGPLLARFPFAIVPLAEALVSGPGKFRPASRQGRRGTRSFRDMVPRWARILVSRCGRMEVLPFDRPGRFWRGNLHTHSDRSDGALPPARVAGLYREAGYDFVVITDHFKAEYGFPLTDTLALRSAGFTTLLGAELHAPGAGVAEWHIIAVGLPNGFSPPDPGESGPALARRARAAGAFIGMAHPAASLLTLADAESLDAAHAVEICNDLAAWEERGDSWHLCDLLLARGHRLGAYAADDAHFQPHDPPGRAAWVQVRAESLDPGSLLAALKSGHYYSSTGPEIHAISVNGDKIMVRCSPASKILVTGGVPGKQVVAGDGLTSAVLPLGMFASSAYVRVTVTGDRGGRAWSNPIWLR